MNKFENAILYIEKYNQDIGKNHTPQYMGKLNLKICKILNE